jgi:DUF4097 and DUF4098 domain-containing protein YvlB
MKRLISLFSFLFLLTGCDLIEKTETETFVIEDTFTILNVEILVGTININNPTNEDNNTVGVIVEKFASALNEKAAQDYIDNLIVTTEFSGGIYRVKVENPDESLFPLYVTGGANLTFNNIDQQHVVLRTTVGDIDCEDITQGDLDVTAGSISVDSVTGPLMVDVVTGPIYLDAYWGDDLELETMTGSIRADIKGSGPIDALILVTTGDISLDISEDRSCEVDLEVEVGDIRVSGVDDYESISPFPGISSEVRFLLNEGTGKVNANAVVGSINVDVE